MDNVKVAKELLRLAKSLVADRTVRYASGPRYIVVGLGKVMTFNDQESLVSGLRSHGIRQTGTEESRILRPLLQGQPTFDNLLGPMYGGPNKVRYETQEAYNDLSM